MLPSPRLREEVYRHDRHVMKQLDASEFKAIGQPLRRKEDLRLLTGKGRFTDDFSLEGQAYAVMVRCPHPHARIRAIDDAAARALPGVLGVFTGQDCIADGLNPIPHEPVPKTKYDMKLKPPSGKGGFLGPHMLLPADKARHVGEAVVMVVAETEEQALDAAEAVQIDYDELPFVTDAARSPRARRSGRVGRGARQLLHRYDVRRRRGDRPRLRGGGPRRQDGFPHRPRHGRDHGAPRRPRRFRPG